MSLLKINIVFLQWWDEETKAVFYGQQEATWALITERSDC